MATVKQVRQRIAAGLDVQALARVMNNGVAPYPTGLATAAEHIEPGEQREEIAGAQSKAAAITAGRRMVKQLRHGGWQLRVWQNSGWHYEASRGGLSVRPNIWRGKIESYSATLETGQSLDWGTGSVAVQIFGRHRTTPDAAAAAAIKAGRQLVVGIISAVNAAEGKGTR